MTEKLQAFADLIEQQTKERYRADGYNWEGWEQCCKVRIKPGKKYTKVDINSNGGDNGYSGKYMVDAEGNIFGIKAYGVIHRGHHYGTLDTIKEWYWGDYTAHRRA
jgi:hypothetical protein